MYMKKSVEIQGLPIFSLIDGEQIGRVKQLIIKPDTGNVQILLVENDQDAIGIHVLSYADAIGVGEFAVTVENKAAIREVGQLDGARELVLLGYKIIGTRVLSRKGQLLGTVDEYYVDPDTGSVTACTFREANDAASIKMFDRANIMTFGRDVIVVKQEEAVFTPGEARPNAGEANAVAETAEQEVAATAPTEAPVLTEAPVTETSAPTVANATPLPVGPNAYLLGKVLSADLVTDAGELVAAQGTMISDDLIDRVKAISPTLFMKLNRLAIDPA